ncbi:MAG: hypothetical protein LBE11_06010, partial [Prevotellaceae bacterium]|nr:hypothetical protein [Prevotellaceae bacterium]
CLNAIFAEAGTPPAKPMPIFLAIHLLDCIWLYFSNNQLAENLLGYENYGFLPVPLGTAY